MKNKMNYYGKLIREARLNRGLSIPEMAEKLNISTRYLMKIENGRNMPSYKLLKKIINIIEMDANVFFYDDVNSTLDMYDLICRKLESCN